MDTENLFKLLNRTIEAETDVGLFEIGAVRLKNLIEKLEAIEDQDKLIYANYMGEERGLHRPDSYRGYYRMLSIEPKSIDEPWGTVGELCEELKNVHGEVLTGYKGGDYLMGDKTWVFISPYGMASNMAVVDVVEDAEPNKSNGNPTVQLVVEEYH